MPVLIIIGFLLALWLFIVWDRRRLSKEKFVPPSPDAMPHGWTPSVWAKWPIHAGLSAAMATLGFAEWLNLTSPLFTGRWSFLSALAYSQFGPFGIVLLWFGLPVVLAVIAFTSWRAST